jgi:hypothetical protein
LSKGETLQVLRGCRRPAAPRIPLGRIGGVGSRLDIAELPVDLTLAEVNGGEALAGRTAYPHGMVTPAARLVDLEKRRLRALVDADAPTLDALHADDFVLIHPGGGVWSRAEYLGGIGSGAIDYRRFEAVSEIEVLADGALAVLRYRSAIDIHVRGRQAGELQCWHTDCYRAGAGGGGDQRWQVVWSQATEIQPGTSTGLARPAG